MAEQRTRVEERWVTGPEKLLPVMCMAKQLAFNSGGSKEPQVRVTCRGRW